MKNKRAKIRNLTTSVCVDRDFSFPPFTGTISISLSPCSIPGKPSNFTIGPDTVEFGLGK